MNLIRRTTFILATVAGLLLSGQALAACTWSNMQVNTRQAEFNPPSSMTLARKGIGEVMATSSDLLVAVNYWYWYCQAGDRIEMPEPDMGGLQPSSFPGVYQTPLTGVGIRIRFKNSRGEWITAPWADIYKNQQVSFQLPQYVRIELVRTGYAVSAGSIPVNFIAKVLAPNSPQVAVFKSNPGSIQVINPVYFESCKTQNKDVTVPMGKQPRQKVRDGSVEVREFTIGVRCTWSGQQPQSPPVKMYFEGDTDASGHLRLTGAGQAGVARGVAIALTDKHNVVLPFNQAAAIPLEVVGNETQASLYRFTGRAQYVSTGAEIEPGSADATMTYVIDYN